MPSRQKYRDMGLIYPPPVRELDADVGVVLVKVALLSDR